MAGRSANKLKYVVASCTSEDPSFPATELLRPLTVCRGWQSAKLAEYPQVVVLQFAVPVLLGTMQILSHECKTPSRIELFIADIAHDERSPLAPPPRLESIPFAYVGYLAFQHNRDARFKSGELKSVAFGDVRVTHVKLIVWDPHHNELNFHHQVGLYTITGFGQHLGAVPDNMEPSATDPADSPIAALLRDLQYDSAVMARVAELQTLKGMAIAREDFLAARRLKDQIDALIPIAAQIQSVEARKRKATFDEDFQMAQVLKSEIEELRAAAMNMRAGGTGGAAAAAANSQQFALSLSPNKLQQSGYGYSTGGLPPPTPSAHGQVASSSQFHQQTLRPSPFSSHQQSPAAAAPGRPAGPIAFDDMPLPTAGGGTQARIQQQMAEAYPNNAAGPTSPTAHHGSPTTTGPSINVNDLLHFDRVMADHIRQEAQLDEAPQDVRTSMSGEAHFPEMMAAFGAYTTCALFSRKHQLREGAIRAVHKYGNDVLRQCDAVDLIVASLWYLAAPAHGLADPVNSVYFAAADLLHFVLAGMFHGDCRAALKTVGKPIATAVCARTGDNNQRVRTRVTELADEMLHCDANLPSLLFWELCEASHFSNMFKVWVGRLDLMGRALLSNQQLLPVDFPRFSKTISKALDHANGEVRDRALDLLVLVSQLSPSSQLDAFVGKMKPSLKNAYDKKKEEAPPPSLPQRRAEQPAAELQDEPASPKKVIPKRRKPAAAQGDDGGGTDPAHDHPPQPASRKDTPGAATGGGSSNGGSSGTSKPPPATRVGSSGPTSGSPPIQPPRQSVAAPPRRQPPPPIPGECQFCHAADPSLKNHDELIQHFVAECAMLCNCPLCGLPVDIREVHWHMTQDCEKRARVKQCPRCFDAVRLDLYDQHVAERKCLMYDPEHIVCPLCHTQLPNNDAFWEVHILMPPHCAGNPRTNVDA